MSASRSSLRSNARSQKKARHISTNSWDMWKNDIYDRYIIADLSLQEVMGEYTLKYAFNPTKKQWKDQLTRWQFRKRLNKEDAAYILYLLEESEAQGFTRRIFFNQTERTLEDIQAYIRKSALVNTREELLQYLDSVDVSPYITWEDSGQAGVLASPNPSFIQAVPGAQAMQPHMKRRVLSQAARATVPKAGAISYLESLESLSTHETIPDEDVEVLRSWTDRNTILEQSSVIVPQTPAPTEAQRPEQGVENVISQSILVASKLSEARRNGESQPHLALEAPAHSGPDPDLLWQTMDTLAWIQVSFEVILLAIRYFSEITRLEITPTRHILWTQIIISLKLAHTLLDDHAFGSQFWGRVLQKHGVSAVEGFRIEREFLAHPDFRTSPALAHWGLQSYEAIKAANSHVQSIDTALRDSASNTGSPLALRQKSSSDNLNAWEAHKEEICNLYLDEKYTLKKLMTMMRERGFVASERAFRSKLQLWGMRKNVPSFPGTGVLGDRDSQGQTAAVLTTTHHPNAV